MQNVLEDLSVPQASCFLLPGFLGFPALKTRFPLKKEPATERPASVTVTSDNVRVSGTPCSSLLLTAVCTLVYREEWCTQGGTGQGGTAG